MLIDSITKKPIVIEKIHGNTKIRNLITGKKDRTMAQWRRAARESSKRLIQALKNGDL
jgi:hypothetical protein